MSFPTTPILDNFNRANENPLSGGGNWSATRWYTTGQLIQLLSNAADNIIVGQTSSQYWTGIFVSDVEAYADTYAEVSTKQSGVAGRITNPGTNCNCYLARNSNGTVYVDKMVSGSDTIIQTNTVALASGDAVGLSTIGTTVTAHWRKSGTWVDGAPISDSALAGPGYIGLWMIYPAAVVTLADNFGGGVPVIITVDTQSVLGEYDVAIF